jgi:hypothetical protein
MPELPHDAEDDDMAPAGFEKFKPPDKRRIQKHNIRRAAENDCGDKKKLTREDVMALRDKGLRGYKCSFCKFWHVTSVFCSQKRK